MNLIGRLSISYKIAMPIIIIVLLFGIISLLSVVKFNEQAAVNETLIEFVEPVNDNLEDAYRDLYQVVAATQGLMLSKSQADIDHHTFEFKDNAYKAVPRMKKVQDLYDNQILPMNTESELTVLITATQRWIQLYEPLFERPETAQSYYVQNSAELEK